MASAKPWLDPLEGQIYDLEAHRPLEQGQAVGVGVSPRGGLAGEGPRCCRQARRSTEMDTIRDHCPRLRQGYMRGTLAKLAVAQAVVPLSLGRYIWLPLYICTCVYINGQLVDLQQICSVVFLRWRRHNITIYRNVHTYRPLDCAVNIQPS